MLKGFHVAAEAHTIDALGQFKLTTALGPIGASVNFTQSNLMMVISGLLILGLMVLGARPQAVVPGRLTDFFMIDRENKDPALVFRDGFEPFDN